MYHVKIIVTCCLLYLVGAGVAIADETTTFKCNINVPKHLADLIPSKLGAEMKGNKLHFLYPDLNIVSTIGSSTSHGYSFNIVTAFRKTGEKLYSDVHVYSSGEMRYNLQIPTKGVVENLQGNCVIGKTVDQPLQQQPLRSPYIAYSCDLNTSKTKGWIPSNINIRFYERGREVELSSVDYQDNQSIQAEVDRFTSDFHEVGFFVESKADDGTKVRTKHKITILPKLRNKVTYFMDFVDYSNHFIARGYCKVEDGNGSVESSRTTSAPAITVDDFATLTSPAMMSCFNNVLHSRKKHIVSNPDFLARSWGNSLFSLMDIPAPKTNSQFYFNSLTRQAGDVLSSKDRQAVLDAGTIEQCIDTVTLKSPAVKKLYNDYKSANNLYRANLRSGKAFTYQSAGNYLFDYWLKELLITAASTSSERYQKALEIGIDYWIDFLKINQRLLREYDYLGVRIKSNP